MISDIRCEVVLTRVLDEKLSLRWYDAQGCLESIGFDFVKRLPLFVVMVMILLFYMVISVVVVGT